jgi:outer membrane cobalamin receptor
MGKLFSFLIFTWLFLASLPLFGQNNKPDSIFQSAVEELINLSKQQQKKEVEQTTSIANLKETTLRETAGIVTIVTKEEIRASGSRDLIDVLRLVPGIEFNSDVYNTVSISMRGNWASEGKILFNVDGVPITETLYGTTVQGNRIPLNHIERIEIIRGPGSAIYGGSAALGVINIVTQHKQKPNLFAASTTVSQMGSVIGRKNLDFLIQRQVGSLDVSLGVFLANAIRSDRGFVEPNGNFYKSIAEYSAINQFFVNGSVSYKKFALRVLNESYNNVYTKDTTSTGNPNSKNGLPPFLYPIEFPHLHIEGSYQGTISSKFKLIPKIFYKRVQPWNATTSNSRLTGDYTLQVGERYAANLVADYSFSSKLNLILGLESFIDRGSTSADAPLFSQFIDEKGNRVFEVTNANLAAFGQITANTKFGNFTFGGRYNYNSVFGNKFVPRAAFTKTFDHLHFKLLYSQAFRAPNLLNISYNYGIAPETTEVGEIEVGYKFSPALSIVSNIFAMNIKNAIVYLNDGKNGGFGSYQNAGNTGTAGAEVEIRLKKEWGFINANYSFYRSLNNTVAVYEVPNAENLHIGLAAHKFNLLGNLKIGKIVNINPSCTFLSERYGQEVEPNTGNISIQKNPSLLLCNLNLHFQSFLRNISASIGVHNIFDVNYNFVQGYQSGRSSLPAPSREFVLKLLYDVQL